jgi:hypothetical protein
MLAGVGYAFFLTAISEDPTRKFDSAIPSVSVGESLSPEIVVRHSVETTTIVAEVDSFYTYGRVMLRDTNRDSMNPYVFAEPRDVVTEGVGRSSPITSQMAVGDIYEITGRITDECWDSRAIAGTEYDGCIAWMNLYGATKK